MKYQNTKGTFFLGNTWVSKNIVARLVSDNGSVVEVVLNAKEGVISLPTAKFKEYFSPAGAPSSDDLLEFESKKNKPKQREIEDLVRAYFSGDAQSLFLAAIKKTYQDAFTSAGSSKALTIAEYQKFQLGHFSASGLNKIGDPVFNRAPRWTPVADESDWINAGDPAPIGIRKSDHARLSQCIIIYKELLWQIFSSAHNFQVSKEIEDYVGRAIVPGQHRCLYCGTQVELAAFSEQHYGMKVHPVNFCHRDPSEADARTRPGNVYFGHTECNRIQGGLSELGRIQDGLRLLNLHKTLYFQDQDVQKLLNQLTAE
jgi:hypothetical protein